MESEKASIKFDVPAESVCSDSGIDYKVATYLLKTLEENEIKHIFGIPGGVLEPFLGCLTKSSIDFILTRHEGCASFMAYGYSLFSEKPAAVLVTTGPGATNAITGVASARADKVPVLVISGQIPTSMFNKNCNQESSRNAIDTVSIYEKLTNFSVLLVNENSSYSTFQMALNKMFYPHPSPVHISVPLDILKRYFKVEHRYFPKLGVMSKSIDVRKLDRLISIIDRSKNVVFLCGSGVQSANAEQIFKRLALKIKAGVLSTPRGSSVYLLKENNLGRSGYGGNPEIENLFSENKIDLLLILGSSLHDFSTDFFSDVFMRADEIVHLDCDASVLNRNYPVFLAIQSDIKEALHYIEKRILRKDKSNINYEKYAYDPFMDIDISTFNSTPVSPVRLFWEINNNFPGDMVYFCDIGSSMMWAAKYLILKSHKSFFLPINFASMGSSAPMAMGAKIASPDRNICAIMGDGSFMMTCSELTTCRERNIPIIWIVLNNRSLGMVYHGQKFLRGEEGTIGCKYKNRVNVAKIADAMGIDSITISSPEEFNKNLFEKVNGRKSPLVINVIINDSIFPPMGGRARAIKKETNH